MLDQASISALKRWQFRPHSTAPKVRVPITYPPPKPGKTKKVASPAPAIEAEVPVPEGAKRFMLSVTRPAYPYEARLRRITGSGLYELRFDRKSGAVTSVHVIETTGSILLDDAAMKALYQWRARPWKVGRMRIPFTFTLAGRK